MSFINATRRKHVSLGAKSKSGTTPLTWEVPKTGLLAGIMLHITGTLAGTITAPNALGKAAIVRNVRLIVNAGIDLYNISGAGYHYLLRDFINDYRDPVPQTDARSAIAAATYDVSMYLPIAINDRDPVGLVMLQNEETLVSLTVQFEDDANLGTGITSNTATVKPYAILFTVPIDMKNDWPNLSNIHQVLEDQRVISGAGDYEYRWPRGNTYMGVYHGLGIGASGSDGFTTAKLMINQSETLEEYDVNAIDKAFSVTHGRDRITGTIPFDLIGTSGLGMFGLSRDLIYSQAVTELSSVIAASGAGTLYTVRRQLVNLD